MGNENSRGSSDVPDKPEAPPVEAEEDLGDQSGRKPSSDTRDETVKAHSNEGSAYRTVPRQEKENGFSLPAEEPGPQELQEKSQEVGQPPSLSPSASVDKLCKLDIAKTPVEHSSEKPKSTIPRIPPEARGAPQAEPGVISLTTEGQSVDSKLQTTAGKSLAESSVQKKPGEISPCSPTEQEHCSEECDDGSFEVIPEDSANKGHSAADAHTREGEEDWTAAEIPAKADSESPLAQRALEPQEKPPARSNHADMKFINGIQNHEGSLTTEPMNSGKEHSATARVQDPKVESLPHHLVEPSSKVQQDLDKAKEPSHPKEKGGTCPAPEAIEMAGVQIRKLSDHPQTIHLSCTCTEVTLGPVAQETQSVAKTDGHAEPQGSSGAQKHSKEGPVHLRKFPKTFYLCCSQCSVRDGEANAEQ